MDTNEETTKSSALTPAQRARKRAADRKFRKSSREKTKSYIAHLEKLVEASSASSSGSEKVQRLMQQTREEYNDACQLRSALANIIELAQSNLQRLSERAQESPLEVTHFLPSSEENDNQEDFQSFTKNSDKEAMRNLDLHFNVHQFTEGSYNTGLSESLGVSEPFHQKNNEFAPFNTEPLNPDLMEPVITNTPDPSLLHPNIIIPKSSYSSYNPILATTVEPPAVNISQPSTTNDSKSIWNSLGMITYATLSSSKKSLSLLSGQEQRARDENVLITAVMHGWHSVPEQDLLDPIWQAIRRIDDQMLWPYRPVEKLALLYVIRLQFLRFIRGDYIYEVPTFMRPRPSQTIIDHLPHAEYYVWPGFREHLFVWPEKYSSDDCLNFMGSCFRFIGPSDPQSTHAWNPCTGRYSLSAEFTERLNDLRCWTVEQCFFEIYPELQGEIPAYNDGGIGLAHMGLWPPVTCPTSPQEQRDTSDEINPPFATQLDTMPISQIPVSWGIWDLPA